MRQSVLVFRRDATMQDLEEILAVEREASNTAMELGYNLDKQKNYHRGFPLHRYSVRFGKIYIGMWDNLRHTFVERVSEAG